ncbi:MAG: hypothetical protein AAFS10_02400 [Myxococcota bacterium]
MALDLNDRLAELRRHLSTEQLDWLSARRTLLAWLAEDPETLPIGLDYINQAMTLADQMGRIARLEEVAAWLAQVQKRPDDQALMAALAALEQADAQEGPGPWVVVSRKRLEKLERLAHAAPPFQAQHARCWSSGGTFHMSIERDFRGAVRALDEDPDA